MLNGKGKPRPPADPEERPASQRLDSWKEIAAYLRRDVSTVQRWEKREGLPVYRHLHEKLGSVYAYKPELDAWWNNRRPRLEAERKGTTGRRLSPWLGAALVLLAGATAYWRFRSSAPAQQEIVTRRVWSGPDPERLGLPSPDGHYCSYTDAPTGDLAIRHLASGEQRLLTKGGPRARWEYAHFSAISPDGEQVAYAWFNQDLFYDLRLVGANGSGQRVLHRNPDVFYLRPAGWSPDGKHILALFRRKDQIHQIVTVAAADGSVRVLKTLDWRFPLWLEFSPDGHYVVYDFPASPDSPDRDIFLLAVTSEALGGREIPLVAHPGNDFVLGWAPDGQTILFASDRTGTLDAWAVQVAGGKPVSAPELIKKDLGRVWPVGFTRQGSYYYGLQTGMADIYLAELEAAGAKLAVIPAPLAQRFIGSNRAPDWSPNGRYLAYVSQPVPSTRWPEARVVIRGVRDQEEHELRPNLNHIEMLRWLPDGRSFLMTGASKRHRQGLFRVEAETGQTTPLIESSDPKAYFHELACSPDRRKVFYKLREWTSEPSRLMIRDLASGQEREFLPSVYRFALSQDGRRLAFSTYVPDRMQCLMVVPVSGGEPRELYRAPGQIFSIAWTPDGRHLLFAKRDQIWRIAAGGGQPEQVAVVKENIRELRIHPDGRRVVFTAGEGRGELWVLENFLPVRKAAR